MKLVAGLGNPESRYEGTRHNIGFTVARLLAERAGIALKRQGYQGTYGVGQLAGSETTVLIPQTYMNRSGASIGSACKSLGIQPRDLIVIHDDIDLPFGQLRIRQGGGHGGHNGIRSITEVLGTGDFLRVKVGVGRPLGGQEVADYVLSSFTSEERKKIASVTLNTARAVEILLAEGAQQAMNEFHGRDLFI